MATMVEFTQNEILECLKQVEELKKIKDINLMGKKLGLRKFKKTEKVLAREMIVNKLQELRGENMSDSDLESLPDAPTNIDEDDEMEEELVVKVEEPEEMNVFLPVEEEMTVPAVEEEKPELVNIEKQEMGNTNEMYQMINEMVEKLRKNEDEMNKKIESLEQKTKTQEETIKNLNEEFENLFKKYELTVSENDKLQSSNIKLKEAVRNLMGDL